MGASLSDLRAILRLREAGFLDGRFSIAEIGAQQISNDVLRNRDILPAYAKAFGVPLRDFGSAPAKGDDPGVEHLPADAPFSKDFWEWLGCPYVAIDYDRSPHIIPLDLNFDDVPEEHRGKYQLVTNFGTTEHVANQMQAMKVIHDLTAPGGLMIHTVPALGYMNHGMVNYNPKFFWALSRSCHYHVCDMRLYFAAEDVSVSPDNIEALRRRLFEQRIEDSCIQVIMQKQADIAYVPPMEIHDGVVDDDAIRARYSTIFRRAG